MNMTLHDKGPVRPPPVLAPVLQALSVTVQRWRGVAGATHWRFDAPDEIDGADFYLGVRELGHIHLDGWVHIPASPPLRSALVANKLAGPFRWGDRDDGWIEYFVATQSDSDHARWLFRLNLDRLRGVAIERQLARVSARSSPRSITAHRRTPSDRPASAGSRRS